MSVPQSVRARRRSTRSWTIVPLAIIVIYLIAAVAGPVLAGYNPGFTDTGNRLLPPFSHRDSGEFVLFGTDQVGQDLLGQILQGARVSMGVGAATLLCASVLGIVAGVLSGYFGGWIDSVVMRLADVQLAFPGILLAVLVASVLGQSILNVIIVLSIAGWVTFARVTRGQVLAAKNSDYVDAARALGAKSWHIIRTAILPACVAPLMVIAALDMGAIILAEASLSFLGLGTPASAASWGGTIANGREYLGTAWWISSIPGIFLAILVVAFGLLGDALRDHLDPRLKGIR